MISFKHFEITCVIANSITLRFMKIQCVSKKKKEILNIYIKLQIINFFKIKLTTHNYICGQMSKDEVCILNIHRKTAL